MQRLAILLEKLNIANKRDKIVKIEGEDLVKVSIVTSAIAFTYEKVRSIVDYKEEHLLRKSAIFRILKRRFLESDDYYKIGLNLTKEMISAGYIENKTIPETKIIEVAKVIEKYDLLFSGIRSQKGIKDSLRLFDWVLGLASVEIEKVIAPSNKESVFVRFMYDELLSRTEIVSKTMNDQEKNMQLFLAVNRTLIKSDKPMLEYLMINLWYPQWQNDYKQFLPKFIDDVFEIKEAVSVALNHKLANRLLNYCRRYSTMTYILREVIYSDFSQASNLIDNDEALESSIREICQKKYTETKKRLKGQIGRAIIYVFLTKMLLALVLEVPFDYYVLKHFNWFAIIVNITFPPLLMILIAITIRAPSSKNTTAMVNGIINILKGNVGEKKHIKEPKKRGWVTFAIFNLIYIISFLVPFVFIVYFLNAINFSILSIALFLVFLSIVSFFGVRIRHSARELIVLKKGENIIGELFDFLTLPFIRFGRFLSLNFSKINIFVFILDFIIEAPLKIVLQSFEEWLAFFKEKKEDLY